MESLLRHPDIRRVLPSMYQGHKIYTVYLENRETFAVTGYRNLVIVARLPLLVEEAVGRLEWRPSGLASRAEFRKTLPTGRAERRPPSTRLYLQTAQLPLLLTGILHPEGIAETGRWTALASWLRLDLERREEGWNIGGAMRSPQEASWPGAMLNRAEVLLPGHLEVIPDNMAMLVLGSVANWNRLLPPDAARFRRYIASWAGRDFALAMAQPRGVQLPADWFLVLSATQKEQAARRLDELAAQAGLLKDYDYLSFRVRQIMADGLLPMLPGNRMENPFFAFMGDHVVFASSQAALEVWIDAFIAGKTLARDEAFLPFFEQGKQQGAWFFYLPASRFGPLLRTYAPQEPHMAGLADVLGALAIRAIKDGNHWQLHGAGLRRIQEQPHSTVAWKTLLSAPALSPPSPVEDSSSRQTCIAVQDSTFRLHLLGPSGDVRWTKTLDGPLLSAVQRMDYYGDGSTTMLLNTARNVYLLDMRGNDVGNFPLPLQSPATNGVTVVNFDGGRQIAFFVACANGNVYGFDRLGRPLPGWNPLPGAGTLRFPLAHFFKDDKDYLVALNEKGVLRVFRRDGEARLPARALDGVFLSPPDYQVSEKSNRIVAANAAGTVFVTGLKDEFFRLSCPVGQGKGVRFAFGAFTGDERHDYAVASGDEIALYAYGQGSQFERVFNRRLEAALDEVFRVRLPGEATDRIGAVSHETGKIFLLDAQGVALPGFPLAGHTPFFAADLYRNGRPVVVTAYGDGVYAYHVR